MVLGSQQNWGEGPEFPYTLNPHIYVASQIINSTHKSSTFVTTDEPIQAHHYHLKSVLYKCTLRSLSVLYILWIRTSTLDTLSGTLRSEELRNYPSHNPRGRKRGRENWAVEKTGKVSEELLWTCGSEEPRSACSENLLRLKGLNCKVC